MSISEKKYNDELRHIEKKLIKRLYTEPMNIKRSKSRPNYVISDINERGDQNEGKIAEGEEGMGECGMNNHDMMRNTYTNFPKTHRKQNSSPNINNDLINEQENEKINNYFDFKRSRGMREEILNRAAEEANNVNANKVNIDGGNIFEKYESQVKKINDYQRNRSHDKKQFNKTSNFFYKQKHFGQSGPLNIETEFIGETPKFKKKKKYNDVFNVCSTENYGSPCGTMRFIDPRGRFNRNAAINFKPKPLLMNKTTSNFNKMNINY